MSTHTWILVLILSIKTILWCITQYNVQRYSLFGADKEGHGSMSVGMREYEGCDELKMNDFPQKSSSSRLVPQDGRMHVCKRVTLRASHSARPVLHERMA